MPKHISHQKYKRINMRYDKFKPTYINYLYYVYLATIDLIAKN